MLRDPFCFHFCQNARHTFFGKTSQWMLIILNCMSDLLKLSTNLCCFVCTIKNRCKERDILDNASDLLPLACFVKHEFEMHKASHKESTYLLRCTAIRRGGSLQLTQWMIWLSFGIQVYICGRHPSTTLIVLILVTLFYHRHHLSFRSKD